MQECKGWTVYFRSTKAGRLGWYFSQIQIELSQAYKCKLFFGKPLFGKVYHHHLFLLNESGGT